jgi:HlyD family secretion protein
MRVRTFLLLPVIMIFAAGCITANPNEMVLSGTIESDSVHAGSRIGGRIAEVMIGEGDNVTEGDVLFRLETNALDAQRAQLESVVSEAEAAYAVVAAGAKPEDIARARNEAEAMRQAWRLAQEGPLPSELAALDNQAASLEAAFRNAQDAAERMENLYEEGAVSERENVAAQDAAEAAFNQWQAALEQLDAARSRPREQEIAAAEARYNAAMSAVRSLESGATTEQLAAAMARVDTAREALDSIQVQFDEAVVTAPSDGIVSSFSLEPGDIVAPGQAAIEIVDMTTLKLYIYVPENRLGFVHEGDEVPFTVDSFPSRTFTGTIRSVAAQAEFTPRNVQVVEERVSQVFAVEIAIDNSDLSLRPGMAADVTITMNR